MYHQAAAILWAQWRSIRNHQSGSSGGSLPVAIVVGVIWYGIWLMGAISIYLVAADPSATPILRQLLPIGLLLVTVYWQALPILMVSTGMSLDIRRLMVYPIPHGELFSLEVLLRITSCAEILLIMAGLAVGLLRNPATPWWGVPALLPFILFNLFLSTGIRDLLTRLLARKRIRELMVFLLVLTAALPQLLLSRGSGSVLQKLSARDPHMLWPWTAAARLASGRGELSAVAVLAFWTVASFYFGRWQFARGLRFDASAHQAVVAHPGSRGGIFERLPRLPSILFPDPLGALIEKEVRFLSRSARFRLVFLMGFSFGLIIWLPLAFQGKAPESAIASNYLTLVSVYALMLLGEVCFWNSFGFDRSAAQVYFLLPVKMTVVLAAKNIAAAFFVLLEISIVAAVCALLQMPISAAMVGEAFCVAVVLTLYLLAIGNIFSVRNPRPVDPAQSWRNSSVGRVQAFLLLVYPIA
ncbi:MAG TPA: hypothetical protein VMZ52_16115, partial [Bryobacteraceae bacterium]|nr:hypothetical protein [Bryobacteraceae bacterium]